MARADKHMAGWRLMEKAIRKDDGQSPETEIASLISEIAARKAGAQASYAARLRGGDARMPGAHPADSVLKTLDRKDARGEIAGIADEIRRRAEDRETARVIPLRAPDWSWIADAMSAQEARQRAEDRRGQRASAIVPFLVRHEPPALAEAALAGPEEIDERAPAFDHAPEAEPELVPLEGMLADQGAEAPEAAPAEPEPQWEPEPRPEPAAIQDDAAEEPASVADGEARVPAAMVAAALPALAPLREESPAPADRRRSRDSGKRARPAPAQRQRMARKELPLWYTLGLPLAAVSAAALTAGIGLMNPPEPVRILAAETGGDSGAAGLPDGIVPAETAGAVTVAAAEGPVLPGPTEGSAPAARPAAPEPAAAAPSIPDDTGRIPAIEPEPEAAPPVAATRVAALLGPKPAPTTAGEGSAASAAVAAIAPVSPVPERVFVGTIADGSAAARLATHANAGAAIPLTRTEERWLARDVDALLDREPDGRLATASSTRGDIFAVSLESTSQSLRRFSVTRAADVAPLPENMVLEGGWFAALRDTPMRPLPSSNSVFENRVLKAGDQVQLLATVTDRNGVRWSLMSQRGVAIGFVSPADIVPSETYPGALGPVFASGHGRTLTEEATVFTRCRTVTLGPFGEAGEHAQFCRNALGHWVPVTDGMIDADYASLEPVVLAARPEAGALPPDLERDDVRASVERSLRYALDGGSVSQRLPDGERLDVTFGETFTEALSLPVARSEDIGRLSAGLAVDAGWKEAASETRLRPLPDASAYLTGASLGAGHAIETLATFTDADETAWTLVGQGGTGIGFVRSDALKPLSAANLPVAALLEAPEQVDIVKAERTCRSLEVSSRGETSGLKACQSPAGQWVIEGKAEIRRLVRNGQPGQIAP